MPSKTEDPKIGDRYFMLTVVSLEVVVKNRSRAFKVRCDCGVIKYIAKGHLQAGSAKSCGCFKGRFIRAALMTHGQANTKLYHSWRSMISRCCDTSNKSYPRYGGRGISVTSDWLIFENFAADMGDAPTREASLDRIDNDKGYNKENCRWASKSEQGNNTSKSVVFDFRGQKLPLRTIAEITGFNYNTLRTRVYRHGMTPEAAVTIPVMTASEIPSHSRSPAFNTTHVRLSGEKLYAAKTVDSLFA